MSNSKHKPGTIRWFLVLFFLFLVIADRALDELARDDYWYVRPAQIKNQAGSSALAVDGEQPLRPSPAGSFSASAQVQP